MIDGHNDLAWMMRQSFGYDLDLADLVAGVPSLRTDIPRLRAGGVTGQFWSVYVPSGLAPAEAVVATLEQIDFVHRMVARHAGTFALATTADEVDAARRDGRIASLIGLEGGHSIASSLGVLRTMRRLGARYMTLTHNDNVPWADSATDTPVLGGLSAFGVDVVREMNAIGMLVDLSHVSVDVMYQAIRVSQAPIIFSHSSARALVDVPRNVPDDVLVELAGNGGVCMVAFVPEFISARFAEWADHHVSAGISAPPPLVGVTDVADHLDHVRDVAGIEHVGIGGDYDGCQFMPVGLEDVACYPALFSELASRGWSRADLAHLATDNVLRVLRAAEDVAST